jgi:hypothetical protein
MNGGPSSPSSSLLTNNGGRSQINQNIEIIVVRTRFEPTTPSTRPKMHMSTLKSQFSSPNRRPYLSSPGKLQARKMRVLAVASLPSGACSRTHT